MIGSGETRASAMKTLEEPLRLAPDHVSLYILENVDGLPFEKVLAGQPVDEDAVADIYNCSGRARGGWPAPVRDLQFRPARQGMPPQPEILALRAFPGPGPVGLLPPRRQAMVQQADLGAWAEALRRAVPLYEEMVELTPAASAKEALVFGCGSSKASTSRPSGTHFGADLEALFAPEMAELEGEGWLLREGSTVRIPPSRFLVSNHVFAQVRLENQGMPPLEAVPLIACLRESHVRKELRPGAFAREAVRRLKAVADPVKAEGVQRYFKDTVKAYGVAAPAIHALAAELYGSVKGAWTAAEAIALCDILFAGAELEPKAVGALILCRFKKDSRLPSPPRSRRGWPPTSWTTGPPSTLCPEAMGAFLADHPESWPRSQAGPSTATVGSSGLRPSPSSSWRNEGVSWTRSTRSRPPLSRRRRPHP